MGRKKKKDYTGKYLRVFVFLFFILIGAIFCLKSIPYFANNTSEKIVDYRVYFSEKIPGYIYLKLESENAFVAGSPINITISTGIVDLTYLQLTIDGASKYFPDDINIKDIGFNNSELRDKTKNVIPLNKHTTSVSKITTFSGKTDNLVFGSGGNFDIGITLQRNNGGIIGYETGMRDYKIDDAIYISPREVLTGFRTNNILIGLAFLAIGISLITFGFGNLSKK